MTAVEPAGDPVAPAPADAGSRLTRQLRDAHLGSMFAGVIALFGVLKVLAVSHYEITTALGIVAESGTASLVMGTLVRNLGSLLLAALSLLFVAVEDESTPDEDRRLYRGAAWPLAFLTMFLLPPVLGLVELFVSWLVLGGPGSLRWLNWMRTKVFRKTHAVIEASHRSTDALDASTDRALRLAEEMTANTAEIQALLADPDTPTEEVEAAAERLKSVMDRWAEHEADHAVVIEQFRAAGAQLDAVKLPGSGRGGRIMLGMSPRWMAVVYVLLAVLGLLSDRPWLPAERVVIAGHPAVTGYVLRAEDDTAVVLVDSPRRIVRLDGAVTSREYCWVQKNSRRIFWPTAAILRPGPSYPLCSRLVP